MLLDPQHPLSLRWCDLDGAHRWGLVRRRILPPRGFSHRDQEVAIDDPESADRSSRGTERHHSEHSASGHLQQGVGEARPPVADQPRRHAGAVRRIAPAAPGGAIHVGAWLTFSQPRTPLSACVRRLAKQRAQRQMVDAQAGIPGESISEMAPASASAKRWQRHFSKRNDANGEPKEVG
jgi:hypothetical protein